MAKKRSASQAIQALLATTLTVAGLFTPAYAETVFKTIPTQFIAALGDPGATSGSGAQSWGFWGEDPGPRGVQLGDYEQLKADKGVAPAQWTFDTSDWWLEEHGLIMEKPDFPLSPGKYRVTGGREVTAVLTVFSKDKDGVQRWELDKGAKLYDVTHLPCRSARYSPLGKDSSCSPSKAKQSEFPVKPGAPMPAVESCTKQDYAVLFIIAVAEEK